jgi:hypothetical protein
VAAAAAQQELELLLLLQLSDNAKVDSTKIITSPSEGLSRGIRSSSSRK